MKSDGGPGTTLPGPTSEAAYVETLAAVEAEHRRELSAAHALNVVYRALLDAAGISAPTDKQGTEALLRYRAAFQALGTADKEQPRDLTDNWWDRPEPFLGVQEVPVPDVWPYRGYQEELR